VKAITVCSSRFWGDFNGVTHELPVLLLLWKHSIECKPQKMFLSFISMKLIVEYCCAHRHYTVIWGQHFLGCCCCFSFWATVKELHHLSAWVENYGHIIFWTMSYHFLYC